MNITGYTYFHFIVHGEQRDNYNRMQDRLLLNLGHGKEDFESTHPHQKGNSPGHLHYLLRSQHTTKVIYPLLLLRKKSFGLALFGTTTMQHTISGSL